MEVREINRVYYIKGHKGFNCSNRVTALFNLGVKPAM